MRISDWSSDVCSSDLDRAPELRHVGELYQSGPGPDRALDQVGAVPEPGVRASEAPRRKGRGAASGKAGRRTDQAERRTGELYRRRPVRPIQVRPVPLLETHPGVAGAQHRGLSGENEIARRVIGERFLSYLPRDRKS